MPESAVLEFAPEMRQRWAWSADDIRRVGHLVVDLIAHHLTSLPERPVFRPFPPELAAHFLSAAVPLTGQEPEEILAEFARDIEPYPFGNGHPRFYGWVNSPPAVIGVFAEALAAAMNPSVAGGNHAATYVERQVLNWFRNLLGFPAASMGLLVSGGSMATLTSLAVARHVQLKAKLGTDVRASGLQGIARRLLIYTSPEGHSCIRKAVELLGLGSDNLRIVPVDARRCLQVQALEAALRQDLEAGHVPIAVAASAGTTNSGAIDPLAALRALCDRYGLWLHVDGAYGAPAILSAQYRQEIEPIALADSVALDPHKWLYVPVEAGLVLVRDGQAMRDTFSLVPPYLRNDGQTDEIFGLPWFSEYGFQQTRGFRALKVWMSLKYHGLSGYAEAITRDIALAEHLARLVDASVDLERLATGLSIVCFRYAPPPLRGDAARLDALNKTLLETLQRRGQVFLSSTTLDGTFMLRACIINPRTQPEDLEYLVALVRELGAQLAEDGV
jgi:aromatic-L-amino-acid/L-tryptophan decarboxylase